MNLLLILPILLPMVMAMISVLTGLDRARSGMLAVFGALLHLCASGFLLATVVDHQVLVLWMGNWPAPAGICLVADYLSAAMVLITSVIYLAVMVYSGKEITPHQRRSGYYPLMQFLTAAICGAFLTGDLFNLYVWFELILMASFGIMIMENPGSRLTSAVKYVTMNLLSTVFLIMAIGLIYGLTGTLNMADLHEKVAQVDNTALVTGAALLLMMAFAIKSALFPLFFWLPATYHTLPVPVAAFFAGMLTKVGVYALIRLFTLVFVTDVAVTHTLLMVMAVLTMVSGVAAAASQMDIRRILSFHIISQVGYMVLGLAVFTPLALAGTLVYLIHHIIVKANLFLVSGLIQRATGSFDLKQTGGLYQTHGLLSLGFFIPAFSLAGFPPLSGFWAKLLIIYACLEAGHYFLGATAAVVGLMTVFSMIKIWTEAFWKKKALPVDSPVEPLVDIPFQLMGPVLCLCLLTVLIGVFMEPVLKFALVAGEQLMSPHQYVLAVKGGG
ncbi:MAG: Na+/H+ antiporter subunit D [Proteobacteria bacterium]|nr:Na+/H+ antiporter subunit D [Pseudomonadota bacterium]MBU1389675.1 Na+/H+ antiporter subunit D [Pseudomonadota bacterium]MBU1542613.1 Na+/H+ antiporter subunit D [Pseudomonadota bacterium]MBU2430865.1 Na+/H+ antiporter subunit D [Pseudomonadota bacterium]MBU2481574.1 Na+/H+ antiporter subunit D [Pseudomonadota bacterium]